MGFIFIFCAFFVFIESTTKVAKLRPGDTVGFISPAGPVNTNGNPSIFKGRVANSLGKLGLNVVWSQYAFGPQYGYLAATDEQRAADVMAMFRNTSIKAIISNRGGWGCDRILELLDFDVIRANPKALMGYSDLTTLINSIYQVTDTVTFHGPMGIDDWNGTWNSVYFKDVLMNGNLATFSNKDNTPITTIRSGKAQGTLIGGNLCVFVSMMGSKYISVPANGEKKFILFLEEVGEAPYRVDRMITTLQISGFLNNVAGVIWGRCTRCEGSNFNIPQVLQQKFASLKVPVFSGAMFGHISQQFTLPLGTLVEMDADKGTITMLEPAVI